MIIALTGFTAGALHVLMGPDHIAALAPVAMDKPKHAMKLSLRWGLGHGIGVICLGALAIFFKLAVDLNQVSEVAEFSVGVMLIVIGLWAIKKAQKFTLHTHQHTHENEPEHQHIHIHIGLDASHSHTKHNHAAFGVGLLHGIAGSGQLYGLLPALALQKHQAIIYLASYLISSVATMSGVGLSLRWLIEKGGRKNFQKLLYLSATASLSIGTIWLWRTWIF